MKVVAGKVVGGRAFWRACGNRFVLMGDVLLHCENSFVGMVVVMERKFELMVGGGVQIMVPKLDCSNLRCQSWVVHLR